MQHIVEELENAADLVSRGHANFDADWVLRRAGKDVIETIGEAVGAIQAAHDLTGNSMPPPFDQCEVPWQALRRMRDRTTHGYHEVDWQIVWTTLAEELPSVALEIRRANDGPESET